MCVAASVAAVAVAAAAAACIDAVPGALVADLGFIDSNIKGPFVFARASEVLGQIGCRRGRHVEAERRSCAAYRGLFLLLLLLLLFLLLLLLPLKMLLVV